VYRLTISIAYEGDYSEDFSTKKEVFERIKQQSKDHSIDSMDVTEIKYVDVYELMQEYNGSVPRED
jgi:hypothetical protein